MPGLWDKIMGTGKKAAQTGVEKAKEYDQQMVEAHGQGGGGSPSRSAGALTISRRDNGDWEIANPDGAILQVHKSKDAARASAESMITGDGKYEQYQVRKPSGGVEETATYTPDRGGGPDLGFATGGEDRQPQMPGSVLGGGDGGGDSRPQMPGAFMDSDDSSRDDDFPDLF